MHINKLILLLTTCVAAAGSPLAEGAVTQVVTAQAPAAIGPYSQAVKAGSTIYISGQIAIDPAVGKITATTIEEQTTQVLKNLKAILAAEGLTLENVVKSDVYLKDLKDFAAMNRIYGEHFSNGVKPARATVQISKLPMDALVEISCIAVIPE